MANKIKKEEVKSEEKHMTGDDRQYTEDGSLVSISSSDLAQLKDLRIKNAMIASRAEKALLEARLSEMEYKNAIQNVYLKYGLSLDHSIDDNTGKISKIAKEDSNA